MLLSMLRDAVVSINDHIRQNGDGPIQGGFFNYMEYEASWSSFNANNHQQTWGVVGASIVALAQYMIEKNTYGPATFRIMEGANQVGHGTIYAEQ